ncbi:TonB-dependent receptor domain-containing protein [Kordiimonas lipolytica]|uniref:TonB-dependent receptor domain-containing protein n=1 Tax=Kordiimonas lipolytica TaxID=1662421 RepID=A0ABV8U564_9PROT|nr:TonB-dependent receptor [Kordiimonas lipolytica]
MTSVSYLAVVLACGGSAAASEIAATSDVASVHTTVEFNQTGKPLSDALLEFTDRTGLGLVFDSRLVANKDAPAITGQYSAKVALDLLLANSGLQVVDVGGNTLAIVPVRLAISRPVGSSGGLSPGGEATNLSLSATAVVDELLIVGTRTSNPPYYKFKPTQAMGGEEMQFGGKVNVSDFLFELPSMLSDITSANTTIFGTPAGLNLADLRGIGPERTLVLVNGRRFVPTFGGSLTLYGVDLNSIPASLVERIEIINGGAATSYGGEAVSGVVNFTLQDHLDGWSGAVQGGITERGDREEILATLTFGNEFSEGRGSVIASLTIDDQSGLFMTDRDVTSNPSGFALNGRRSGAEGAVFTRGFGGSSTTPAGLIQGVSLQNGGIESLDAVYYLNEAGTAIEEADGSQHQIYNFAEDHTLITPIDRVFATLNLNYDIAPGHKLVFENSLADTNVVSQLAPIPLQVGAGLNGDDGTPIAVPLDNPYIPDPVRALLAAQGLSDAAGLILSRRIVELGPRRTHISRRTLRSLIGFQGMMAPGWSYDVYYQFGRNEVDEERDGLLDIRNYEAALNTDLCSRTVGCSLINPFGVGHWNDAQIDFLKAPNAHRKISTRQNVFSFAISGPLDGFTDEDTKLTVGLEYRHEALDDEPDPALEARPVSGSLAFPGSSGSFDAIEGFFDVTAPLLKDKRFAEELTATFGMRLSDFSTTSGIINWHAGGYWATGGGVSVRLSYQSGRRAPNIAELFAGGPSGFDSFQDPCGLIEEFEATTLAKNCRSKGLLGVPDGYTQVQSFVDIQSFGNPNLTEERSTNLTWGIAIDSDGVFDSFLGRFRLSVDTYRIKVSDYIVNLDADQLLDVCYQSEGLTHLFCGDNPVTGSPYIQRDQSTGSLLAVTGTIFNAGRFWLKGYDVEFQYMLDLSDSAGFLDGVSITGLYSRNLDAKQQNSIDGPIEDLRSLPKYPKHRLQAGVSFDMGKVTVDWDVRFRGRAITNKALGDLPEARIPAALYNDVAARVRVNKNITFYGGIRNLFDEDAPRIVGGSVQDTFPEFYDTVGRRFYLGAVFDF